MYPFLIRSEWHGNFSPFCLVKSRILSKRVEAEPKWSEQHNCCLEEVCRGSVLLCTVMWEVSSPNVYKAHHIRQLLDTRHIYFFAVLAYLNSGLVNGPVHCHTHAVQAREVLNMALGCFANFGIHALKFGILHQNICGRGCSICNRAFISNLFPSLACQDTIVKSQRWDDAKGDFTSCNIMSAAWKAVGTEHHQYKMQYLFLQGQANNAWLPALLTTDCFSLINSKLYWFLNPPASPLTSALSKATVLTGALNIFWQTPLCSLPCYISRLETPRGHLTDLSTFLLPSPAYKKVANKLSV